MSEFDLGGVDGREDEIVSLWLAPFADIVERVVEASEDRHAERRNAVKGFVAKLCYRVLLLTITAIAYGVVLAFGGWVRGCVCCWLGV